MLGDHCSSIVLSSMAAVLVCEVELDGEDGKTSTRGWMRLLPPLGARDRLAVDWGEEGLVDCDVLELPVDPNRPMPIMAMAATRSMIFAGVN